MTRTVGQYNQILAVLNELELTKGFEPPTL
jgi:hypothetical protein